MKNLIAILSLGVFLSSYPILLNAAVCSSLIKEIDHDINQAGDSIQTTHFPWMNIFWLKKRLGPPHKSSSEETSSEYSWNCAEDIYLTVTANQKGLVTEVSGQYSSEEGAEFFSTSLPQNTHVPDVPITTQVTTMTSTPKKVLIVKESIAVEKPIPPKTEIKQENNPLAELLNPYNTYFQTSLKTKDELMLDMTNRIKNFYKNMRSCAPGIYRYAIYLQSGYIFPVTTIEGKKKGLCKVGTLFSMPKIGEINAKCLYQFKNLNVYTDQEAEALVKGKSFDKAHPSPRDRAEAASCETYINGKLQPKLVV